MCWCITIGIKRKIQSRQIRSINNTIMGTNFQYLLVKSCEQSALETDCGIGYSCVRASNAAIFILNDSNIV